MRNIINIGVDLDGVCANFIKRFSQVCNELYGSKCYIIEDEQVVKHWDWYRWYPIKEVEEQDAWKHIVKLPNFWLTLEVLHRGQWDYFVDRMSRQNDINVYFITTRKETEGLTSTKQSATWLLTNGWKYPFVIRTKYKEKFINDLNIEFFIDDNGDNLISIKEMNPNCKVYAQDVPYNLDILTASKIDYKRVSGLRQFADDIIEELHKRNYDSVWK